MNNVTDMFVFVIDGDAEPTIPSKMLSTHWIVISNKKLGKIRCDEDFWRECLNSLESPIDVPWNAAVLDELLRNQSRIPPELTKSLVFLGTTIGRGEYRAHLAMCWNQSHKEWFCSLAWTQKERDKQNQIERYQRKGRHLSLVRTRKESSDQPQKRRPRLTLVP